TTARMKAIVAQHGWPGKRMVGATASHTAWLLVQHADADTRFQHDVLGLLEKAHARGDVDASDVAYLTDRVLVHDGRPQRYGTQFHDVDGTLVPNPIEDPAHVDERRATMNLGPIGEYAAQVSQTYKKPAKVP